MKTVIRNGRIVTAVDDYNADILIDGEQVTMIAKKIDVEADKTIELALALERGGGWKY